MQADDTQGSPDTKNLSAGTAPSDAPPYDDTELLTIVRAEMERSVGFENDAKLKSNRERALDYYKGDMKRDIPSLPNRSGATSNDIADAVETILPDLMEIFTAGGDVAAFIPIKPDDEAAARQETDYLNHVIFQDNPGFLNLMTGFKDGLLLKTCVFEFGWRSDYDDEEFTGKSLPDLIAASQSGQVLNVKADPPDPDYPSAQQTYSFSVRSDCSGAEYWPVPPDDFSVSPDTVRLAESAYCVARSRPRVQDLIADGYDEDTVTSLEGYTDPGNEGVQRARDTAGEHEQSGSSPDDTTAMLRQVEVRKHCIRLKSKDGDDFEIWRIVTNADASKIIPKDGQSAEKLERVPFAGGSPYVVGHRFYGLSLAEQLFETQRIKSVLTRSLLDSSYFALNQRYEVAMDQANDYTISDLLRNEPAVPVRSKSGNAVRPLSAGGLGFDAYSALEYFSTVGEQRTGVVRNAQGLNPDTLHDTAKGAMMLMQAAQRRVRMIARVLAETVVKELYLGLHALIREHAEAAKVTKLNGSWVTVDPTTWGERNSMTIEVGLGASGRDQDLAAMTQLAQTMTGIVAQQGGADGPIVTRENAYNAAIDLAKALGRKQPERYFTNPASLPPAPPPPPNPTLQAAQIKASQMAQAAAAADATRQRGQDIDAQVRLNQTEAERQTKALEIQTKAKTDIITTSISGRQHDAIPHTDFGGNTV